MSQKRKEQIIEINNNENETEKETANTTDSNIKIDIQPSERDILAFMGDTKWGVVQLKKQLNDEKSYPGSFKTVSQLNDFLTNRPHLFVKTSICHVQRNLHPNQDKTKQEKKENHEINNYKNKTTAVRTDRNYFELELKNGVSFVMKPKKIVSLVKKIDENLRLISICDLNLRQEFKLKELSNEYRRFLKLSKTYLKNENIHLEESGGIWGAVESVTPPDLRTEAQRIKAIETGIILLIVSMENNFSLF